MPWTWAHLDAKESEEFSETVDKGLVISATPMRVPRCGAARMSS